MEKREIKFRYWNTIKMMENVGVHPFIMYNHNLFKEGETIYMPFNPGGSITVLTESLHLMQYIGLKDKNGKEIYEGDILLELYRNHKFKVFSVGGGFAINTHQNDLNKENIIFYSGLSDMQTSSWIVCCEIIGNIYETPNLLL